jgi:hypothetical protein
MERSNHELMESEPTLPERPRRRRLTTAYKLAIVEKYDALSHGDKGALLRREGLYSASVTERRRARDAGCSVASIRSRRKTGRLPPVASSTG